MPHFQYIISLGMGGTICEKDWGAPDPISEEGIAMVSKLLRSGRLHRYLFLKTSNKISSCQKSAKKGCIICQ